MRQDTLKTMIGQLISIGFEGVALSDDLRSLIREYKIGNYSIYAHNCTSKEQMRTLNKDLHDLIQEETGLCPMVSADQEGGMVTRLSDNSFTHYPGAMAVASTGNDDYAFFVGQGIGSEMRAVGFNTDFAPVVDINSDSANPVIGVRAYSDNAADVTRFALKMAAGLSSSGVLPVFKHFPGHGSTNVDSHFGLPRIDKSLDEMLEVDLVPYIKAIACGSCHAIMTSHIIFTQIEKDGRPATMSRFWLTDFLRGQLGFKGIVKTDDLLMEAIKSNYGVVEGAIEALKAGADVISISRDPVSAAQFLTRLYDLAKEDKAVMAQVETAYERVMEEKSKFPSKPFDDAGYELVGCEAHHALAQEINDKSVSVYPANGPVPYVKGKTLVLATNAFNQTNIKNPLLLELNAASLISKALSCDGVTYSTKPDEEEVGQLAAMASAYDTVIMCTYNANIFTGQLKLAERLAGMGKNLSFIAMRNPYDLPLLPGCPKLALYEYTPHSIESLVKVLKGQLSPKGNPCVRL